jgi:hypothetical protein
MTIGTNTRSILSSAAFAAVVLVGCADGSPTFDSPSDGGGGQVNTGGNSSGGNSSGGVSSGGGPDACGGCEEIATPDCFVALCNDGMHPGPIGTCVVVPDDDGMACDDGMFCTTNDTCVAGVCTGGPQNTCGIAPQQCEGVTCTEASQNCSVQPASPGDPCVPTSLCDVGGTCTNGLCIGTPNDCFFAPVNPCELAVCDPADGVCKGQSDATQDGTSCVDPMELCSVNKTCAAGLCLGGAPKDCSALNVGCTNGVCDTATGLCGGMPVGAGGQCFDGVGPCETGACDAMQTCITTPVMNGVQCDDFSTCTTNDQCSTGVCTGTLDPMCSIYFEQTFETCPPPGWSLNQEWECGVPTTGPMAAFQGTNVLGTDLDSNYENGESYDGMFAETPPIGLGTATSPVMMYYHYVDTEGSVYDGYNVKVSTDGGQNFTVVQTIQPPYNLTINSQPAYGGHINVWEQVVVDLSAYTGQQIIVRFSFRSDGSVVYPGIYIDDIQVLEAPP